MFLRGGLLGGTPAIRPPWALGEAAFVEQCTRCGDCISACAENIIETGSGGFPAVSFVAGECTFCGDCRNVCKPGALALQGERPWAVTAVIGDDCLGAQGVVCRLCEEQCEARAIRFPKLGGAGQPEIDVAACTGCGACISSCPTETITANLRQPSEAAA